MILEGLYHRGPVLSYQACQVMIVFQEYSNSDLRFWFKYLNAVSCKENPCIPKKTACVEESRTCMKRHAEKQEERCRKEAMSGSTCHQNLHQTCSYLVGKHIHASYLQVSVIMGFEPHVQSKSRSFFHGKSHVSPSFGADSSFRRFPLSACVPATLAHQKGWEFSLKADNYLVQWFKLIM